MRKAEAKKENIVVVQKSNPFLSLYQAPFTLTEYKLLDVYLSRINIRHPENREVTFTKTEIEKILGAQVKADSINKWLKDLSLEVVVETIQPNMKCKVEHINVFEKKSLCINADGRWEFSLCCTQSSLPYIFNIEQLGYLRYGLSEVLKISSRSAYLLFLYLEHNRYRKSWEVAVEDLRKYLDCTGNYENYKQFNQKILQKSKIELETKLGVKFDYVPSKKDGKQIVALQITLEDAPANIPKTAEVLLNPPDDLPQWWEPIKDIAKTEEQRKRVEANLWCFKKEFFDKEETTVTMKWYRYLERQVAKIHRRQAQKNCEEINDTFEYLIKIIQNDVKHPVKSDSHSSVSLSAQRYLNRSAQREYSTEEMDELEKMLISKTTEALKEDGWVDIH